MHRANSSNLIIDNGNTRCKAFLFADGQCVDRWAGPVDALHLLRAWLGAQPVAACLVSSVGPSAQALGASLSAWGLSPIWFSWQTPMPLHNGYAQPQRLGLDRLAAAVGARHRSPQGPSLVVDMGTAITIDLVDAQGVFRGGNISPGVRTRYRALHGFTEQLPLLDAVDPWPPFGHDTTTAMHAGVQMGVYYELQGYLRSYRRRYKSLTVFLTGGEAFLFAEKFKNTIFAPELVAEGLNAVLQYNTDLLV